MNTISQSPGLRDPQEVAYLLAIVFIRSAAKRARVSEKTLKMLGFRERLRLPYIEKVRAFLSELGFALIDLDSGFGLMPCKALEAAKTITAKRWLHPDELEKIKHGLPFAWPDLWAEVSEHDALSDDVPDEDGEQ